MLVVFSANLHDLFSGFLGQLFYRHRGPAGALRLVRQFPSKKRVETRLYIYVETCLYISALTLLIFCGDAPYSDRSAVFWVVCVQICLLSGRVSLAVTHRL